MPRWNSSGRAAFLKGACGAGDELRRGVQSLFDQEEQAEGFLEVLALADKALARGKRARASLLRRRGAEAQISR